MSETGTSATSTDEQRMKACGPEAETRHASILSTVPLPMPTVSASAAYPHPISAGQHVPCYRPRQARLSLAGESAGCPANFASRPRDARQRLAQRLESGAVGRDRRTRKGWRPPRKSMLGMPIAYLDTQGVVPTSTQPVPAENSIREDIRCGRPNRVTLWPVPIVNQIRTYW
jgi:hypothetical protein